MKLVAQLISVTFFSIYLIYILKKERKGKDKDKDKEIQIVDRKETMITLLSLFSRRFPTKFILLTGIAEIRLIPRTDHCKTNYETQLLVYKGPR